MNRIVYYQRNLVYKKATVVRIFFNKVHITCFVVMGMICSKNNNRIISKIRFAKPVPKFTKRIIQIM